MGHDKVNDNLQERKWNFEVLYYQSFRSEQYIYNDNSFNTSIPKGVFNIITGILNNNLGNQTLNRLSKEN